MRSNYINLSPKLVDALFLVLVAAVYVFFYIKVSGTSGPQSLRLGWFDWWDQSQYLKSASAFYRLDLSSELHWYPIGYSLLGAFLSA